MRLCTDTLASGGVVIAGRTRQLGAFDKWRLEEGDLLYQRV